MTIPEEHRVIVVKLRDLITEAENIRRQWHEAGHVDLYNEYSMRILTLEEVIQVIYDLTYGED